MHLQLALGQVTRSTNTYYKLIFHIARVSIILDRDSVSSGACVPYSPSKLKAIKSDVYRINGYNSQISDPTECQQQNDIPALISETWKRWRNVKVIQSHLHALLILIFLGRPLATQNHLVCFLRGSLMLGATRTFGPSETVRVSVLSHLNLPGIVYFRIPSDGMDGYPMVPPDWTGTSKAQRMTCFTILLYI